MELLADYTLDRAPALGEILRSGWAPPEPDFVWSMGPCAGLDIPLPAGEGLIFLELALRPFTHDSALPRQTLQVTANGAVLQARTLGCACVLRLDIPPDATNDRDRLVLTLGLPDAASPQALGLSEDGRLLGVCLSWVKVLRAHARNAPPPPAGPGRLTGTRFGANEATAPMLIEGWGDPETDFVWATGRRSTLRVPIPPGEGETGVLIDILPHTPTPQAQKRIVIGADDRLLGFVAVGERTCLGFVLPDALRGARSVVLSFDHLDHGDTRDLAFMLCRLYVWRRPSLPPYPPDRRASLAGRLDDGSMQRAVQAATGQNAETIARGFMGLGWSCELAALQRRLGWDYAGLFRFAGIWTWGLIDGLLDGFWGLGRPDTLSLNVRQDDGRGYWVAESAYGLAVQTAISSLAVDEAALKRQLGRTLPLLARKFFEDLAAGERIWVFQRRNTVSEPELVAVVAALSVWGDLTVLWIVQDNARAGQAERLGPRLLRGFVDDYAPWQQGSDDSWLSVLANAWMITKGRQTSF